MAHRGWYLSLIQAMMWVFNEVQMEILIIWYNIPVYKWYRWQWPKAAQTRPSYHHCNRHHHHQLRHKCIAVKNSRFVSCFAQFHFGLHCTLPRPITAHWGLILFWNIEPVTLHCSLFAANWSNLHCCMSVACSLVFSGTRLQKVTPGFPVPCHVTRVEHSSSH